MSKRRIRSPKQAVVMCAFTGLVLSLLMPMQGRGQQTSPVVAATIDEAATPSTKQPPILNQAGLTATPEGFESLKLAPGYLLQMDVYNTPEMSTELRIDEQGDVTIPLIGSLHIGGDTLSQAQNAIAKALVDKEILQAPEVTLNIVQFAAKNISVLGEVHGPGRIQLLAPEPLGDVLALAGGETIAAGNDVEIQHRAENGELTSRHIPYAQGSDPTVLQSVLVNPGETVLVHRAGVIYVLGAVTKPGGYLMVNSGSLSVIQAISLAGGTTLQASTRWAVVVRRQGSAYVQFRVPLGKMQTGNATPIQLQLNDALYVPVSTWKSILINGSNVISGAASAAVYRVP